MVRHGIGKDLHEDPQVPNFGRQNKVLKLRNGLVIAIESIINFGKNVVYQDEDGWVIVTADGLYSAHFEHTIVVRNGEAQILSSFEFIEEYNNI